MRHYDVANRNRNQFTGIIDFRARRALDLQRLRRRRQADDYPDTSLGLQHATFRTVSFGADFREPNIGLGAGGSYNFERYSGLAAVAVRPARAKAQTTLCTTGPPTAAETVNYFSIYVTPPRFGEKTEARLSYDFSHAEGSYLYTVGRDRAAYRHHLSSRTSSTSCSSCIVDVRHRISNRLAATFSISYEPFRVYDFAFDPSVVNSIVQPSSLVLGYTCTVRTRCNSVCFRLEVSLVVNVSGMLANRTMCFCCHRAT